MSNAFLAKLKADPQKEVNVTRILNFFRISIFCKIKKYLRWILNQSIQPPYFTWESLVCKLIRAKCIHWLDISGNMIKVSEKNLLLEFKNIIHFLVIVWNLKLLPCNYLVIKTERAAKKRSGLKFTVCCFTVWWPSSQFCEHHFEAVRFIHQLVYNLKTS